MRRGWWRRAAGRAGLALGGVLLAVAVVEGVLRLRFPSMVGSFQGLYERASDVGYKMKPALDVDYRTGEYATRIRSNALGFRDDAHEPEPAPGTFRVLVLGDSMTEALQVPFEATFHQQLERRLGGEGGDDRVEVVVMGGGGYNLAQEYAAWRFYGRRFRPHLVLLALTPNDIEPYPGLGVPPTDAQLRRAAQAQIGAVTATPAARLYRSLRVYVLVRDAMWQFPAGVRAFRQARALLLGESAAPLELFVERGPWMSYVVDGGIAPEHAAAWRGTLALVRGLAKEVREQGAAFGLVLVPFQEFVEPQRIRRAFRLSPDQALAPTAPEHYVARAVAEDGIPMLSLRPAFEAAMGDGRALYFRYDRHLSAAGHAVASAELAVWCRNQWFGARRPEFAQRRSP